MSGSGTQKHKVHSSAAINQDFCDRLLTVSALEWNTGHTRMRLYSNAHTIERLRLTKQKHRKRHIRTELTRTQTQVSQQYWHYSLKQNTHYKKPYCKNTHDAMTFLDDYEKEYTKFTYESMSHQGQHERSRRHHIHSTITRTLTDDCDVTWL